MSVSAKTILKEYRKFYKHYNEKIDDFSICGESGSRYGKKKMLSIPEIATILTLYNLSHYTDFKHFYLLYVEKYLKRAFPKLPSYSWFLRMRNDAMMFMVFYLHEHKGKKTGIYFIDSTPIKVCRNQRINNHKTFKNTASRGHTSMGWFFGFKLHLIINDMGELMDIYFSRGNEDDRIGLIKMAKTLYGLLIGDKGYISQKHKETLAKRGLRLVTKLRKNMKKQHLTPVEKHYLYKRGLVETVIGSLKLFYKIENKRLKSFTGLIINIISSLVAYTIAPVKPQLNQRFKGVIRI